MNAVVKHRPRSAKEQQDGWASFLRVLARNSKLKFRIGKNVGPSTDGKTINLPALPANLTPEDLVLFKRFGYHEVGHCMHSDIEHFMAFSKEHGRNAQFMLNALDDVFMEEAQARFSKVAERTFREGIALMVERKIFRDGSASPFEAICCYVRTALGARKWPEFVGMRDIVKENFDKHFGEHADDLRATLDEILFREFPNVRSTKDAGMLTLRILAMLKQQSQQQEEPKDEEEPEDDQDQSKDDSEESESDSDSSEGDDESESDEGGDAGDEEQSDGDSDDDSNEGSGESDDQDGDDSQTGSGSGSNGDEDADGEEGDDAGNGKPSLAQILSEALEEEVEEGEVCDVRKYIEQLAEDVRYGNHPDYQGEMPVPDFEIDGEPVSQQSTRGAGKTDLVEGMLVCPIDKEISNEVSKGMDRKFQVLATKLQCLLMCQDEADVQVTRRGRIGESNLYRFALGDTRFFEQVDEVERVAAAVSIVADLSGSTCTADANGVTAFSSIQKSLMIMEKMLDQLGNPREIIGFAPCTGQLSTVVRTFGDDHLTALGRIGGLSHVVGGGHTPIGEAVFSATNRILSHQAQRKVMFVMTDGAPSNVDLAVEHTQAAQAAGVTVVYLLIGSAVRSDWLHDAGIPFAHAVNADELCPVLLEQAQALLM